MPWKIPESLIVRDFMLADAAWPARQTLELLHATTAELLVLRRNIPGQLPDENAYYVFPVGEAIDRIEQFTQRFNTAGLTAGEALDVHEYQQQPVVRLARAPREVQPRTVLVAGRGRPPKVVGVFFPRALAAMVGDTTDGPPLSLNGESKPRRRRRRGASAAAGEAEPVEVQRTLVADMPESIALGDSVALTLWLAREAQAAAHTATISAPLGSDIEITVRPYRGIELVGTNTHTLTVTDEDETPPVLFTVRATAIGSTKLLVYAFRDGTNIASIRIPVEVVAAAVATGPSVERRVEVETPSPASSEPDLELHVLESEDESGRQYELRLTSRSRAGDRLLDPVGSFTLTTDPLTFFRQRFQEIEDLPIDSEQEQRDAIAALQRLGSYLFEHVVPERARERLWELRDQISSMLIQSEEPWIPWELIRLSGKVDGRIVEKGILCDSYLFARTRPATTITRQLSLANIAVIAPRDAGLAAAARELEFLKTLADNGRSVTVVPPRLNDVLDVFTSGRYDGIHFCGHGEFAPADPAASVIKLEGGHVLRPIDISGAVKNLGLAKPLIILNACESGRQARSLAGTGGWAEAFLAAGCGAFISTHWSIVDENGEAFTRALYPALIAGKTIGEAVRTARQALFADHEPDYLAYVVFAHPLARVG